VPDYFKVSQLCTYVHIIHNIQTAIMHIIHVQPNSESDIKRCGTLAGV